MDGVYTVYLENGLKKFVKASSMSEITATHASNCYAIISGIDDTLYYTDKLWEQRKPTFVMCVDIAEVNSCAISEFIGNHLKKHRQVILKKNNCDQVVIILETRNAGSDMPFTTITVMEIVTKIITCGGIPITQFKSRCFFDPVKGINDAVDCAFYLIKGEPLSNNYNKVSKYIVDPVEGTNAYMETV